MNGSEFNHFINVLRAVYAGRTTMAEMYIGDLSQQERDDWFRLAETMRNIIGDSGVSEYITTHREICCHVDRYSVGGQSTALHS